MNTDELPALKVKSYLDIPKNYTGIIEHNGTKYWYKNGGYHRDDGPVMEYSSGTKVWYKKGLLHRNDGPAIENPDGTKEWWLKGRKYSFGKFFETTTDEGKEAIIWKMNEY